MSKVVLPSLLDKLAVRLSAWRSTIGAKLMVDKELSIIETTDPGKPITLRFGYVGNIQYHALTRNQIDELMVVLSSHASRRWKVQ